MRCNYPAVNHITTTSGLSTVVEHSTADREIIGSNQASTRRKGECTQQFIFFINGTDKLECYITRGCKGLPVTNNLAY
jgi:hypothetical protein